MLLVYLGAKSAIIKGCLMDSLLTPRCVPMWRVDAIFDIPICSLGFWDPMFNFVGYLGQKSVHFV